MLSDSASPPIGLRVLGHQVVVVGRKPVGGIVLQRGQRLGPLGLVLLDGGRREFQVRLAVRPRDGHVHVAPLGHRDGAVAAEDAVAVEAVADLDGPLLQVGDRRLGPLRDRQHRRSLRAARRRASMTKVSNGTPRPSTTTLASSTSRGVSHLRASPSRAARSTSPVRSAAERPPARASFDRSAAETLSSFAEALRLGLRVGRHARGLGHRLEPGMDRIGQHHLLEGDGVDEDELLVVPEVGADGHVEGRGDRAPGGDGLAVGVAEGDRLAAEDLLDLDPGDAVQRLDPAVVQDGQLAERPVALAVMPGHPRLLRPGHDRQGRRQEQAGTHPENHVHRPPPRSLGKVLSAGSRVLSGTAARGRAPAFFACFCSARARFSLPPSLKTPARI